MNLHRGGGGGGEGGGGGIQKQWTQKWKWNTLQTRPEQVTITKQQYTWSTGTKAQHPRKIGQFIRKHHKLLHNLF